jgi:RNA polymerase sigma factor (sigma-70 family)
MLSSQENSIERLLRELTPPVLSMVSRRYGDFDAAEDAVQEARLEAAIQWPANGVPSSPRAWLIRVASRRMTDTIRSESARRHREYQAAVETEQGAVPARAGGPSEEDDTLALFYMCCHPALTPASSIALTLRAVGGLTTREIAQAFFVPEATMAQRISRAKQSIKASGTPFELPDSAERENRLGAVLHVLYLIFNEGYVGSSGPQLIREDLAAEAIRLARVLHALQPKHPEVAGLLALMLLTDARRHARTTADGDLIPLHQQDRGLWDQRKVEEGIALLTSALARGAVGPYQLQAAIAAVHDEAARYEDTDWAQILALYELLARMSSSPMVLMNRAIAVAMVHGYSVGLELLSSLDNDSRLAGHHRLTAVRAHLLELQGNLAGAVECYRSAAALASNLRERNYLLLQAARLAGTFPHGT